MVGKDIEDTYNQNYIIVMCWWRRYTKTILLWCVGGAGIPKLYYCDVLVVQVYQNYIIAMCWWCRYTKTILLLCVGGAGIPKLYYCYVLVVQVYQNYIIVMCWWRRYTKTILLWCVGGARRYTKTILLRCVGGASILDLYYCDVLVVQVYQNYIIVISFRRRCVLMILYPLLM